MSYLSFTTFWKIFPVSDLVPLLLGQLPVPILVSFVEIFPHLEFELNSAIL